MNVANALLPASTMRLSTADVRACDRHEWLHEVIGREYANVEITAPADQELFNEMTISPWRDLQLSAIRSNGISLQRPPREPQLIGQDAYFAVILLSGEYRLRQDGREAFPRSGDLVVYDAARAHRIDCPGAFRKLIVSIPRKLLADRMACVDRCTALRIPGDAGIGAIASSFIRACAREAQHLAARDFAALSDYSLDLLTRAIASVRPQPYALGRRRHATIDGVKACVERHIADSSLDTAAIAARVGLSPRYINSLFATENTSLMRYVWERRLEHCRRAMRAPANDGCAISELAYRHGFSDPAHFSRAFKKRFGCSPRDYRELRQSDGRGEA